MKQTQEKAPQRLEKSVEVSTLCAYYGGLLTQKQREALRLHYDEDYSLGEIAEQMCVTRQNVHELITRSEQKLRRYEQELGGARKTEALVRCLAQANELLIRAREKAVHQDAIKQIDEAMTLIMQAISRQEGEENENGL